MRLVFIAGLCKIAMQAFQIGDKRVREKLLQMLTSFLRNVSQVHASAAWAELAEGNAMDLAMAHMVEVGVDTAGVPFLLACMDDPRSRERMQAEGILDQLKERVLVHFGQVRTAIVCSWKDSAVKERESQF
jgi:hypothetical protein